MEHDPDLSLNAIRQPVCKSRCGRYLETESGRLWFYLADTAWQLFQALTRDEIDFYLSTRTRQGFNAVQAVAYPEFGGIDTPNARGDLAMLAGDPAQPNPAYFDHIAWGIDRAAEHGMVVALLPTWGSHVTRAWATGPIAGFDAKQAASYGRWIAERLGDRPNLIWVIGGDRPVEDPQTRAVWDALAESIREHEPMRHLMAFHPPGGSSSSRWVGDADWLDLHWVQSGHWRRSIDNGAMLEADAALEPRRPVMDAEPCYENHPIGMDVHNPWFDDYDVRRAAWQALLAGACGHTYGCHDVWMMATREHKPVETARGDWRSSLSLPGAGQMRHVRELAESLPLVGHFADRSLCGLESTDADRIAAARDGDPGQANASRLVVYTPLRRPEMRVDVSCLRSTDAFGVTWLDPRTGDRTRVHGLSDEMIRNGWLTVGFPEGGPDWVLVVEAPKNS